VSKPENLLACVQYAENMLEYEECQGARQELDALIARYHAVYFDALKAQSNLQMSLFERFLFLFTGKTRS